MMRTEQQIREELERIEKELQQDLPDDVWASLNSRRWALKWVLNIQ